MRAGCGSSSKAPARRRSVVRGSQRGAGPGAPHPASAPADRAGCGSAHRQGQLLHADSELRRVGLASGPGRGTDGAGHRALGRRLPKGGGGTACVPRCRWQERPGGVAGRAGSRMRRGAVPRPGREGTNRRRRRRDVAAVRGGAGVRGRGAGIRARPAWRRVPQLPVGRGGGEDLPMAAGVPPRGLRTEAGFARSGAVLPPRANVPAAARRGACGAGAPSCGAFAPHRPVRPPALGSREAKPGDLPELAGEGLRRLRRASGAETAGARRGEGGVRESGQRAVPRDGAGGRAAGRGARAKRTVRPG